MKATLEFSLPEDRSDHFIALHGIDLYCFLSTLRDDLRGHFKHGDPLPDMETLYQDINQVLDLANPE